MIPPRVHTTSARRRSALRWTARPRLERLEPRFALSVTGSVFSDLDGNGLRDPGEPGLAGVPVYLESSATTVLSQPVPLRAGEAIASPLEVSLPSGAAVSNVVLRVKISPKGAILPNKFQYEQVNLSRTGTDPVGPVTVAAYMAGNLDLTFDDSATNRQDLRAVNQAVDAKPPDGSGTWTGVYNSRGYPSFDGSLYAFKGAEARGTWVLKVELGSDGTLDSWSITVSIREAQATTDANGDYTFDPARPGSYVVTPDLSWSLWGLTTAAGARAVTVPSDGGSVTAPGVGIRVPVPRLSGQVTTGGLPALAGFPIYLDLNGSGTYDRDEPLTATDIHGAFAFSTGDLQGVQPGTYSVAVEPGRNWKLSGSTPRVTLSGAAPAPTVTPDRVAFALVNNAPPTQGGTFDPTTFDVSPAEQLVLERVNQIRANPRGVLASETFLGTSLFQQRERSITGARADWTAAVGQYPDMLPPVAWDPNLLTEVTEQGEQARDLAARRLALIPRYVPTVDMAGNPVKYQSLLSLTDDDFQRIFGGRPVAVASPRTGNFEASFRETKLPGLAGLRGYGTTAEQAVANYYEKYRAYLAALRDPAGISHWVPEGRYGDSFGLRDAKHGGHGGGGEGLSYNNLLGIADGYIIDPPSPLSPLAAPYGEILATGHGGPYIDPGTRTIGVGTVPNTWAYLGKSGVEQVTGAFYDRGDGSVYAPGVYGRGTPDSAYVVGVVYSQAFFGNAPVSPQYSYLAKDSMPVAGALVELTAYRLTITGWEPFSRQSVRTWSGGGYQFRVDRPSPFDNLIRVDVTFLGDPNTVKTGYIATDPRTENPQAGEAGVLRNVKLDHPMLVVVKDLFTTPELAAILDAFNAARARLLAAFGLPPGGSEPVATTGKLPTPRLVQVVRSEVRALADRVDAILAGSGSSSMRQIAGGAIRDMLTGQGAGSLVTTLQAAARDVTQAGGWLRRAERLRLNSGRIRDAIEQARVASDAILNVYYSNTDAFGRGLPDPSATASPPAVVRARRAELGRVIDQGTVALTRTIRAGLTPGQTTPGGLHQKIDAQLASLATRVEPVLLRVPNSIRVVQTADDAPLVDSLINSHAPGTLRAVLGRIPDRNPASGALGAAARSFQLDGALTALKTFRRQMLNILWVGEMVLPRRRP